MNRSAVPFKCGESVRLHDGQLGHVVSVHQLASGWELVVRTFNHAQLTSQTRNIRLDQSPNTHNGTKGRNHNR